MLSKTNDINKLQIIDFEEAYTTDFKDIHQKWFESDFFKKHFFADQYDYELIANPYEFIVAKGGHIFLAKMGDKIVGTVALIKRETAVFELSKLMVLKEYRGLKVSDELIKVAIQYSKTKGIKTLWLESIQILKPAISLFRKHGFTEIPLGLHPQYARADIKMSLNLEP